MAAGTPSKALQPRRCQPPPSAAAAHCSPCRPVQALRVHPDKPGSSPQQFQQLADAYETLHETLQAWQHPFLSGDAERHEAQRVAERLCASAAQLVRETPGAVAVRAELGAETDDAPAAWVRVHAVGAAGQLRATRHMSRPSVLLFQLPSGPGWAPTARPCWPTVLALQKLQQQADCLPGGPGCLCARERGIAVLSLQQAEQLCSSGDVPPQLLSPAQLAALGGSQGADQAAQTEGAPPAAGLPPPLLLLGGPAVAEEAAVAEQQAAGAGSRGRRLPGRQRCK